MQALNFKNIKPLIKASRYLDLRNQVSEELTTKYGIEKPELYSYLLSKFSDLIAEYQDKNIFPEKITFLDYEFKTQPLDYDDYALGKNNTTKLLVKFLNLSEFQFQRNYSLV